MRGKESLKEVVFSRVRKYEWELQERRVSEGLFKSYWYTY